jgi:hypothetical protein
MDDHFPSVFQEQYPSLLNLNEASQNLSVAIYSVLPVTKSNTLPTLIFNAMNEIKMLSALDQNTKLQVVSQLDSCSA